MRWYRRSGVSRQGKKKNKKNRKEETREKHLLDAVVATAQAAAIAPQASFLQAQAEER